jgi:two-component system alkaline phosphatase synthesis response regulator PhoP/two-component system response regulator ResD
MAPTRILLVDDDSDLLEANRLYLQSRGLEVAVAHSAAEGLAVLEGFQPDVITADLMMEHHDSGFTFCKRVKDRPQTAHVPVIMLTGVMRETGMDFTRRTREERAWIKADEVVRKPVSPQELHDIISRLLQGAARTEVTT